MHMRRLPHSRVDKRIKALDDKLRAREAEYCVDRWREERDEEEFSKHLWVRCKIAFRLEEFNVDYGCFKGYAIYTNNT
jgi:hypothetical protein